MKPFLAIDEASCTFCGDCAAVCPRVLISVENSLPTTPDNAAEVCIYCGHCVAVCPESAIDYVGIETAECQPLLGDWRSTPATVEQLIKGRRSIRRYRPEPVEKALIESVLDIARYAPTGMNSQTVEWLVVHDRAEVKKLASSVIEWMRDMTVKGQLIGGRYNAGPLVAAWDAGYDPILRGCPHVIIAHGKKEDHFAPGSCIIALTTAELAALPFGLGACWAGFLHLGAMCSPDVQKCLGLPDGNVMYGGLMIGYPMETYHAIPPRKKLNIVWR